MGLGFKIQTSNPPATTRPACLGTHQSPATQQSTGQIKNASATGVHGDVCPAAEGTRQRGTGFLAAVVQMPILLGVKLNSEGKGKGWA